VLLFFRSFELGDCFLCVTILFISLFYLLKEMGRVLGKSKTRIRKRTILLLYPLLHLMK